MFSKLKNQKKYVPTASRPTTGGGRIFYCVGPCFLLQKTRQKAIKKKIKNKSRPKKKLGQQLQKNPLKNLDSHTASSKQNAPLRRPPPPPLPRASQISLINCVLPFQPLPFSPGLTGRVKRRRRLSRRPVPAAGSGPRPPSRGISDALPSILNDSRTAVNTARRHR